MASTSAPEEAAWVGKGLGTENPSDLMTKHVDAKTLDSHVKVMGCTVMSGRAELAPQVVQVVEDEAGAVDFEPRIAPRKPLRKIRHGAIIKALSSSRSLGWECKGHDFAGTGECAKVAQGSRAKSILGCKHCRPRSRGLRGNMSRFGMAVSTPTPSPAVLAFEPYRSRGGVHLTSLRSCGTPCIGHARICHERQCDCRSMYSIAPFPLDAFWAQDR